MTIQLLPDDVISQIAAGEVVERPASVVKELIENALDAGAHHIYVDVVNGGQQRIRVSDDGIGILPDEVPLALMRHATSKLRHTNDLQHIETLGFRGEALASIAAVSQLTLVTRHRDSDVGSQIRVEGGIVAHTKPTGTPAGTIITVENLFYNTPARLKFLKSEATEKRNIASIVMNYAMAYPSVRFILNQDGRETFRSSGTGQLADVVVKVLGLELFKEMIEVSGVERVPELGGELAVWGFVSNPELTRKDRSKITLFVNGRAVQDAGLSYAVTQAYHMLMDKGRNPYAVLMIRVPGDFVDVNVHPTKAEVRFQDTNSIFVAVQRTIRQGILGYRQSSNLAHVPRPSAPSWVDSQPRHPTLEIPDRYHSLETGRGDESDELEGIPEGIGRPERPRTLPLLRVVGQIGASYIIAEGPAGMYLIDQHAAHSRVIYQELIELRTAQNRIPARQLDAQTIELNASELRLLLPHLTALAEVGYTLELFGSSTFLIRAIPAILPSNDPAGYIWQLLQVIQVHTGDLMNAILTHIAESSAVKVGQLLSTDDMKNIVRQLERCPDPHTSPSGHATLIHMTAQELEREFRTRK